jgi:hypothetical protein
MRQWCVRLICIIVAVCAASMDVFGGRDPSGAAQQSPTHPPDFLDRTQWAPLPDATLLNLESGTVLGNHIWRID